MVGDADAPSAVKSSYLFVFSVFLGVLDTLIFHLGSEFAIKTPLPLSGKKSKLIFVFYIHKLP